MYVLQLFYYFYITNSVKLHFNSVISQICIDFQDKDMVLLFLGVYGMIGSRIV